MRHPAYGIPRFLYGRGGEYVIGKRIRCSAQPEQRVCAHVAVVNLCALPADCTDLKLKVESCLLFRVSCRKFISEIPSVCALKLFFRFPHSQYILQLGALLSCRAWR